MLSEDFPCVVAFTPELDLVRLDPTKLREPAKSRLAATLREHEAARKEWAQLWPALVEAVGKWRLTQWGEKAELFLSIVKLHTRLRELERDYAHCVSRVSANTIASALRVQTDNMFEMWEDTLNVLRTFGYFVDEELGYQFGDIPIDTKAIQDWCQKVIDLGF